MSKKPPKQPTDGWATKAAEGASILITNIKMPAPVNPGPIPGVNFESWLADIMPEVADAQKLISEQLSKDHSELSAQASIVEDMYARMCEVLSQANRWHEWYDYVELGKIDPDLTVMERSVILKVKTAQQKLLCDKLEAITKSLYSRMRRSQWQV